MINLEKISGLRISLNDDNKLEFHAPLKEFRPVARTLDDMKNVLQDPNAHSTQNELYYMYRNIYLPEDEQTIKNAGVSYDITVIPPGKVGAEYIKTAGHYHAVKAGTDVAYPEAYEVLNGRALFLLQKMDPLFDKVVTMIAVEANAGDKIVYPPNYGHIIVNIGSEVLVTSNWVGDNFERMYQQVSDRHGLGYKFEPNPNYEKLPEIRMITRQFMNRFELMGPDPMYVIGTRNPKSLEFLTQPEKYAVELSSITS
jgi:glucose-6-phosphate isomerase